MALNDLSGIGGTGSGGISTGIGGSGITLSDAADAEKVEYRTISIGEITAKELTLSLAPHAGGKLKVDVVEGSTQYFATDYTIVGDKLQWTGLGLDGLIAQGDILRIVYLTS